MTAPHAIRVTGRAHAAVREHLCPGDNAVDATAGNGHDTAFLADLVGDGGAVWAFDIQDRALAATAARLRKLGLASRVQLVCSSHHIMAEFAPPGLGAVMFNLGYFPGGDHELVTRPGSTTGAIAVGLGLLRPGGVLTCVVYPGHPGGAAEAEAVLAVFDQLSPEVYSQTRDRPPTPQGSAGRERPFLVAATRL